MKNTKGFFIVLVGILILVAVVALLRSGSDSIVSLKEQRECNLIAQGFDPLHAVDFAKNIELKYGWQVGSCYGTTYYNPSNLPLSHCDKGELIINITKSGESYVCGIAK